jgi:hypothetical protein
MRALVSLIGIICFSALGSPLCAQTNKKTTQATEKPNVERSNTKRNSEADAEAARILRERRANAQSLLISLAADAVSFHDSTVRARTLARIADLVWELDTERARNLFRKAWDAAEIADKEGDERLQEDIRNQQAGTGSGGYAVGSPPDLRKEVLRLAAKRDRALGEEFLEKLKAAKLDAAENSKPTRGNPLSPVNSAAVRQRTDLARHLLESGDLSRAIQFADPVLSVISMYTIDFLSHLRDKDPAAADQRYAAMLANAGADTNSDANTVSLLSSYLFSPHLFIAFVRTGTYTNSMGGNTTPPMVAPELRAAFFRVAASILLRPPAPPGQDQTSLSPDGQYLVIKRLLPLFEQYAQTEMTTAMRAQMEALASITSVETRQRDDDEFVRKGVQPDKPAEDREQSLLNQIDRAKTSAERDQLYFQLASYLSGKDDLRARDFVDKIDDTEMRHTARAYIDSSMAMRAPGKKDADWSMVLARTGELTHLQRSWLLSQTAKWLVKTDREKALSLIEEAAAEAERIEGSDSDRPRAFLALANAVLTVNRPQVWDVMSDAVKAANSAEGFTGEDGQLTFRILTKNMRSMFQTSVSDFDLAEIFDALAKEDYEKTVDLAHGFQREAPRAAAVIAIARSVLAENKK